MLLAIFLFYNFKAEFHFINLSLSFSLVDANDVNGARLEWSYLYIYCVYILQYDTIKIGLLHCEIQSLYPHIKLLYRKRVLIKSGRQEDVCRYQKKRNKCPSSTKTSFNYNQIQFWAVCTHNSIIWLLQNWTWHHIFKAFNVSSCSLHVKRQGRSMNRHPLIS